MFGQIKRLWLNSNMIFHFLIHDFILSIGLIWSKAPHIEATETAFNLWPSAMTNKTSARALHYDSTNKKVRFSKCVIFYGDCLLPWS